LIERRVRHEVDEHNRTRSAVFQGLIQPAASVVEGDGYRVGPEHVIEGAEQCRIALEAFERQRFLLLVDGRQVGRLDDEVVLARGTEVRFLKIVPLAGG
jgi:hypothetical protein